MGILSKILKKKKGTANYSIDDNPWEGLSSYEDEEKVKREGRKPKQFCGRDDISHIVTQLITGNIFVTLYGKSGTGKTSLINAGVFPLLRQKKYLPVSIRLSMDALGISFQECIIHQISLAIVNRKGTLGTTDVTTLPEDEQQPDYLWSFFARSKFMDHDGHVLFPVIVLDQFEEIFRDRRDEAEALLRQIAYMMDESHALSSRSVNGLPYKYDFNFRFVASIREDDLYRLENCIDNCYLPELKRCRYRLRSLSEQGARDVILIPGEPYFIESERDAIVETLIGKEKGVARNKDDNSISTNLLSLICNRLYAEKQKKGMPYISLSLVESFVGNNPFKNIYNEATKHLSRSENNFIEDNFVDSIGRRKQIPEKDFQSHIKNESKLLIGNIRIFQYASDSEPKYVELIHDKLAEFIFNNRTERIEEEYKRKKKILKWALTILGICSIPLFIFYGYRHDQISLYSELQPTTEYSDPNALTAEPSNMAVGRFIVRGQDDVKIKSCYLLQSVEFSAYQKENLTLSIKDCPLLDNVSIPSKVKHLILDDTRNCPKLIFEIGSEIDSLIIRGDIFHPSEPDSLLEFNTEKSKRYVWTDKVLWDIIDKRIIYTQLSKGKHTIPFPYEIDKDSIKFYESTFYNANTKIHYAFQGDTIETYEYTWNRYQERIPRSIKKIIFNDRISYIYNSAFEGCSELNEITIPKNIRRIEYWAFANCTKLSKLTIEGNNVSIGDEAFAGCASLDSIFFEGDTIELEWRAFANCNNLRFVKFASTVKLKELTITLNNNNYNEIKWTPYIFNPFMGCLNINKVYLPKNCNLKKSNGILTFDNNSLPFMAYKDNFSYSQNGLYSQNGILYDSITINRIDIPVIMRQDMRSKVSTPTCIVSDSVFFQSMNVGKFRLNSDTYIALIRPIKKLSMPPSFSSYIFIPGNLEYLDTIVMPYPQPRNLTIELPDSIKKRIVLIVPNGCKRNYELIKSYSSFKLIKEEGNHSNLFWNYITKGLYAKYEISHIGSKSFLHNFLKYYYFSVPIILLIIGIRYLDIRSKKRNKIYTLCRATGSVVIIFMIWSIVSIFSYLTIYNRESDWIIHIILTNFATIVIAILLYRRSLINAFCNFKGLWIKSTTLFRKAKIHLTSVSRNVHIWLKRHKNTSLWVGAIFVFMPIIVWYRYMHNLDTAIENKKWGRAINLLYNNISAKDTLTSQDSMMLKELLVHSIEIPDPSGDGYLLPKDSVINVYSRDFLTVCFNFSYYGKHRYQYRQYDFENKTCYNTRSILNRKNNIFYEGTDTIYVYRNRNLKSKPQKIRGWEVPCRDESVLLVHDNDQLHIYDTERFKLLSSIRLNSNSFRTSYVPTHNLLILDHYNPYPYVMDKNTYVDIINNKILQNQSFKVNGEVKGIIQGRYLVTEYNKEKLNFYDLKQDGNLIGTQQGRHSNSRDNYLIFKSNDSTMICNVNEKDNTIQSVCIERTYSDFMNGVVWGEGDSLCVVMSSNMKCKRVYLDRHHVYRNKINDTLFCRKIYPDLFIYHIKDSVKLLKKIPATYFEISENLMAASNNNMFTIYDLSDSLRTIQTLPNDDRYRLGKDKLYGYIKFTLTNTFFPIGGKPDETINLEGNIVTKIYDGWCFVEKDGYYQLINIDPLRSLIKKSKHLSEKKKQNLYRLIDKNKIKRY